MASIILCNKTKAKTPYYIKDINLNIYTIEELCFYICNNIYLIDYKIISDRLISWIKDELDMEDLALNLEKKSVKESPARFVWEILSYTGFCEEEELDEIVSVLVEIKDEKEEEQRKKKADNYLKNGKNYFAIREYELILQNANTEYLGNSFYGKVYHNNAVAYARMFLFKNALENFEKAYKITKSKESLKEYIACAYFTLDENKYKELVNENEEYLVIANELSVDLKNYENQYSFFKEKNNRLYKNFTQRISDCKEEYRKSIF